MDDEVPTAAENGQPAPPDPDWCEIRTYLGMEPRLAPGASPDRVLMRFVSPDEKLAIQFEQPVAVAIEYGRMLTPQGPKPVVATPQQAAAEARRDAALRRLGGQGGPRR